MAGYTFTPIPGAGPINNNNQIALGGVGAVYANGVVTDIIGTSGIFDTGIVAINNSGEVLAYDEGLQLNDFDDNVFVEDVGGSPSAITPPVPPGSPHPPYGYENSVFVYALNDSGTILGEFTDQGAAATNYDGVFPFLYANGNTTLLFNLLVDTTVYGAQTNPVALNDSGEVIGNYSNGFAVNDNNRNGFLYSPINGGTWTTIDDPAAGTGDTYLLSINYAGQIIGYYDTPSDNYYFDYYFLYTRRTIRPHQRSFSYRRFDSRHRD